jgi:hypothetical protein
MKRELAFVYTSSHNVPDYLAASGIRLYVCFHKCGLGLGHSRALSSIDREIAHESHAIDQ